MSWAFKDIRCLSSLFHTWSTSARLELWVLVISWWEVWTRSKVDYNNQYHTSRWNQGFRFFHGWWQRTESRMNAQFISVGLDPSLDEERVTSWRVNGGVSNDASWELDQDNQSWEFRHALQGHAGTPSHRSIPRVEMTQLHRAHFAKRVKGKKR